MSRYVETEFLKFRVWQDWIRVKEIINPFVDGLPSIEVVQCKDCKHLSNCNRMVQARGEVRPLVFCSFGEEEEEDV